MIDINLIPLSLRKSGKGSSSSLEINIPKDILIGVAAGVILILLTLHLILGVMWLINFQHLSACKAKWQDLSSDKKTLDSINDDTKNFKNKFNIIAGITTQKLVDWSPKFNAVSDALSRGLWLRRMVLNKDGLLMEGSVVSKNQNEITNVGLFLAALKQNDDFMKDFSSLEVNSIQRNKNNAVDVADFTVMAKLK